MPTKSRKNHPQKLHTYGSWNFFSLQPRLPKKAQNLFYPTISGRIFGTRQGVFEVIEQLLQKTFSLNQLLHTFFGLQGAFLANSLHDLGGQK